MDPPVDVFGPAALLQSQQTARALRSQCRFARVTCFGPFRGPHPDTHMQERCGATPAHLAPRPACMVVGKGSYPIFFTNMSQIGLVEYYD